jgi:hypothetical protein
MSRESRLIVILAVIGAAGVIGLTMVANQYRKALERVQIEQATRRAEQLVNGYLAAREAAKAVIARYPDSGADLPAEAADAYRSVRFDALSTHGLTYDDYAGVRTAWKTYRGGGVVEDPALAAVFDARRVALDDASRGPVDAVDDAIK